MLLKDNEVITRLESPLNLINRLNSLTPKRNGMEIFVPSSSEKTDESSAANSTDESDPDEERKIKMGLIKAKALDILGSSLEHLKLNLHQVSKIEKLATVAKEMKNIITDDNSHKNIVGQQVIIYKPIINDISKYETLVVRE